MSLFRTRRSVKPAAMDTCREVPPAVLQEILEDAHWAPTHGLTQPWRFHVFTGPARDRLAEGLQALYDREVPLAEQRADKREKLGATPRLAPVAIVIVARVEPAGKIPELEEIAATACAVQNLLLSAHERGLGAYWSTPPVALSPGFVTWLGLDATHRALGLVYLGHPRADLARPVSARAPLATRVVFHAI